MRRAKLTLPWPPSVNHIWRRGRRGTFLSEEALAFRKVVWVEWVKAGKPRFSSGVRVLVVANPPDRRRRDLDNLLKSLLDALVSCGCIEDDSLEVVHELSVAKGEHGKGTLEVVMVGQ